MGGLHDVAREATPKRRSRTKAVTVLGVAGALSLAGGASASIAPAGGIPTENTAPVILGEEEISDVSLSTFYVFDNENAGAHRPGIQLAKRTRGHGGCFSVDRVSAKIRLGCRETRFYEAETSAPKRPLKSCR